MEFFLLVFAIYVLVDGTAGFPLANAGAGAVAGGYRGRQAVIDAELAKTDAGQVTLARRQRNRAIRAGMRAGMKAGAAAGIDRSKEWSKTGRAAVIRTGGNAARGGWSMGQRAYARAQKALDDRYGVPLADRTDPASGDADGPDLAGGAPATPGGGNGPTGPQQRRPDPQQEPGAPQQATEPGAPQQPATAGSAVAVRPPSQPAKPGPGVVGANRPAEILKATLSNEDQRVLAGLLDPAKRVTCPSHQEYRSACGCQQAA